ncbi:hypothetical protein ACJX0J_034215, partial [Zea mays]
MVWYGNKRVNKLWLNFEVLAPISEIYPIPLAFCCIPHKTVKEPCIMIGSFLHMHDLLAIALETTSTGANIAQIAAMGVGILYNMFPMLINLIYSVEVQAFIEWMTSQSILYALS